MVSFAESENRTCIEIALLDDDDLALEDESFLLTLSVPPGVGVGNITISTVTILDDDGRECFKHYKGGGSVNLLPLASISGAMQCEL